MPRAPFRKLLIANRGEIAIRIARAAAELGHRQRRGLFGGRCAVAARCARPTKRMRCGRAGATAYLDVERRSIALAKETGCDAIHPGYGFLARERRLRPRRARRRASTFVGPSPETLDLFGDKARARERWPTRAASPIIDGAAGATAWTRRERSCASSARRARSC